MENKRRSNGFWAFLMASVLSFGGVGCVTSGFVLKDVDLLVLLLVCAVCSLIWTIVCRYRRAALVAGAVAVVVWLLKGKELEASLEVLLYEISSALHRGYGWPMICWSTRYPTGSATVALGAIACIVSLIVTWTVIRQKKATVAAIAAFLPMGVCLILTDTVPDSEYLMLMLGGLLLLALTNQLRCMDARQASRLTALLLVPVMLVTFGFFWIAPREGYTPNQSAFDQFEQWLQNNPFWQQLTGSGPSLWVGDSGADEVSLDTLGGKSDSDQVALYVTSTASGYLYLRGRGYDTYDGKHWTASEHSSGLDRGWAHKISGSSRVTIRMTHAREFYYFPGECGPKGLTSMFEYGMLTNPDGQTTYTFHWGTPVEDASISSEVRQQCLLLPEETEKWAKEALREMNINLSLSSAGKANRIANIVRACAQYNLDPEKMPVGERDFAKWFYTEADSGYCIHFATTATVLLRAAGVPARYVTGYALGVMFGEEMAVPQSRAHAWVEYYDEAVGWTVLDPTPGYNDTPLPTEPTEPTEETTVPTQPSSRPTEPTQEATQQTLPPQTQPSNPGRPAPGTQPGSDIAEKIVTVLLWVLIGCAAVWGQYRLRIRIRRWHMTRGQANEQALARWKSVRIRSRIFGRKPPEKLLSLAEKAKYSQYTLTEEELTEFDLYMTALAAKIQKKPWLLRWLLRLFWAIE